MKHIVLGLSVAALLAGCSVGRATPGETVQEFVTKMSSGECVSLGDYIAEVEPKGPGGSTGPDDDIKRVCTVGIEQLKSIPLDKQRELRIKQANVLDVKENGDRAIAKIELETEAGEKSPPQLIALIRTDGRWRIDLTRTRMLAYAPTDTIPDPAAEPQMTPPPGMMMPPSMGPEGPGPGPGMEEAPSMGPPGPAEAPPASPPTQPSPAER